jgi:hypothetical protein
MFLRTLEYRSANVYASDIDTHTMKSCFGGVIRTCPKNGEHKIINTILQTISPNVYVMVGVLGYCE